MFPHRVREDVPSVGERAQKTGKEGVTNSKDPNGKLSLKEREFKARIIGDWGEEGKKGQRQMAEGIGQAVDMCLYFPTTFLLFPLLLP